MNLITRFATGAAFALAAATLSISASDAQANLLANPGFETQPLVDDGNGVGKWNPFSSGGTATSQASLEMPRSGLGDLKLELGNVSNGFAGAFQDVPAIPGNNVTFSGWMKDAGQDAAGPEVRIEWFDGVGGGLGATPNTVPALTPGTYSPFSVTAAAPAGAATARVVVAIQSFGAGPNQLVYVDDTVAIPEPASLALLGLGGLAMLRRR